MPTISPLPSPRGTSHERLYILRGGARRSPTAAYDSRGRDPGLAYDDVDPVNELFGWITQNLDDAAQNRLSEIWPPSLRRTRKLHRLLIRMQHGGRQLDLRSASANSMRAAPRWTPRVGVRLPRTQNSQA
jgi:hypothetical protein